MANTTSPVRNAWASKDRLSTPASGDVLLKELVEFTTHKRSHAVVWRGIDSDQFKQCPKLAREIAKKLNKRGRQNQLEKETKTLLESAVEASSHWADGDTFRNYKEIEKLAFLQHYGLDTPLLDVSFNPFVALWFATRNANNPDNGLVVGFSVPFGHLCKNPGEEYAADSKLLWPDEPRIIVPPVLDPRVRAQNAAFLFSPMLERESWDSALSDVHLPADVRAFRVEKGRKDRIRRNLDRKFAINSSRILPDVEGFREYYES